MTMHGCRWVGLVAAVAMTAPVACQTPQPSQPSKSTGNPWLRQDKEPGKTAVAEAAPEPAIAPNTHFAAGRLHESQNQLSRAIQQYQAAIALDPRMTEVHNRLGVCYTRLGNYAQAEEHFLKAIALRPDAAHLRNNLAFCYISQRRWADAEAELNNALQIKPDFVRARVNLGVALAQQRRPEQALEAFRAVLTEEDAQFNLGLMYQSIGQYEEAGEAFRAALAKNPKLVAAKERLDKLAPMLEKTERAKQQARTADRSAGTAVAARAPKTTAMKPTKTATAKVPPQTPDLSEVTAAMTKARDGIISAKDRLWNAVVARAAAVRSPRTARLSSPRATRLLVTLSATALAKPVAGLDVPDDLWLLQTDPQRIFEEAECTRLQEDPDVDMGVRLPLAVEICTEGPEPATAAPAGARTAIDDALSGSAWFMIDAPSRPNDPFLAFPHR